MTRTRPRLVVAAAAAVVLVAALVAVLAVPLLREPGGNLPGGNHHAAKRPPRLFSAQSPWNRPLSASAALDPSSSALAGALRERVADEIKRGWGPWIATWSYSTPIYRVPAGQPGVRVALDDPSISWRRSLQSALERVPIPKGARPALGTDGHLTIWQPSTDRLWEFWHARKDERGGWHASWGGAIEHVSRSPGYYRTDSWSGAQPNWGASATSLPVAAGTMTVAELRRGRIDHALAIALPYPRKDVFAWPAQRTDGTSTDPRSIPEGAHLRIDPRLDLSRLRMPRMTRMMAEAAQRYGMIVRDRTGHALQFYAEDGYQYGGDSIYKGPGGFFEGRWPADFLSYFPWKYVRVLKMDLHRR